MEETAATIRPSFPDTMNWKEMKIRELLEHCLEIGGHDAWYQLEQRLRLTIKGTVARRLLRNRIKPTSELVEDLTQDTWAKLFNKDFKAFRHVWPDDHAVFAYVKTVAGSAVMDHLRRPERQVDSNKVDIDDPEKPVSLQVSDEVRKITKDEVERILYERFGSEFDFPRDRAIFWYFYEQGYSARQIAEISSLSATKIAYILLRMINAVRQKLGEDQKKMHDRAKA